MSDRTTAVKRLAAAPVADRKKKRRKTGITNTTTTDNDNDSNMDNPTATLLRLCAQCQEQKLPLEYSVRQRKKGDHAKCRSCIDSGSRTCNGNDNTSKAVIKLHKCRACHRPKHRTKAFAPQELAKGLLAKCHDCLQMALERERLKQAKQCSVCNHVTTLQCFSKSERQKTDAKCKYCWTASQIPKKECRRCRRVFRLGNFPGRERSKEFVGMCYYCLGAVEQVPTRRCSRCRQEKKRACFANYQCWEECCARTSTCLHCLPIAQRRAEAWKTAMARAYPLWKAMGTVFYKLPMREELYASCGMDEPSDLQGTYKVLFHRAQFLMNNFQQQRTNKGTLTLTMSTNQTFIETSNQNGVMGVEGKIEFESEAGAVGLFGSNYNIYSTMSNSICDGSKPWVLRFVLDRQSCGPVLAGLTDRFNDDTGMVAELRVIAKRIALPWQPTEDFAQEEENRYAFPFPCLRTGHLLRNRLAYGKDKVVEFDSFEEAEALLQRHESWRSGETSWITKHLPFNSDVAKHIHKYCSWCPPPVLLLEPGDLVLTTILTPLTTSTSAFSDLVVRKID